MKRLFTLFALCLFANMGLNAQTFITIPHLETFDTWSNCGGSCTSTCLLQSGWSNDPAMLRDYAVDNGGTSSSSTGPSVDHTQGNSIGKYLYTEASSPCYSGTNTWGLLTPYINRSGTNSPQMEFWYHMYGQSMGTMHVDGRTIVNGTPQAWQLDLIPAWTDNVDLWQMQTVAFDSIVGGDTIQFRIRRQNPTSFYGDGAVDDFRFYDLLPNDAGVARIDSPSTPACGLGSNVYVTLCNYGTDTLTSVNINWSLNGSAQTAYSWTGALPPGDCDSLINIGSASITVGDTLVAYTSMPNGSAENATGAGNDSTSTITNLGLSGTYTVGGTNPDYASFQLAIDDVAQYGICGPVVFDVAPGTYTEQLLLDFTPQGASSVNTVTFRSANSNPSGTVLTYSSFLSGDNYTIRLENAEYWHFEDLTIRATGLSYGRVLDFNGGANWNAFEGNWIEGDTTPTTTSTFMTVIYSSSGTVDNHNVFRGNVINGGSYGTYWYGGGTTSLESGNIFEDNDLVNQYYFQFRLYYQDGIKARNNRLIENSSYTSLFYSLYCIYCNNDFELSGNIIERDKYGYGIYLSSSNGTSQARGMVYNNFVNVGSPTTTGSSYGIYFTNSGFIDFVHNSVRLNSNGTNSRAFYGASGGANNVRNNIFVNEGPGYAAYIASPYSIAQMDNNDLYAPNGSVGYYNGAQATLANWQTATGFDLNSVSVDPQFHGQYDLHVCNDTLDAAGEAWPSVMYDIDGDMRNALNPDIGADEISPLSPGFLGPDVTLCTGDSVSYTVGAPGDTILWSTGSTSRSETLSMPGTYTVTVNGFCGSGTDTVIVAASAITYSDFTDADTSMACDGDSIMLVGAAGYDSYLWSTGDTTMSIMVTSSGTYTLDVADACGSGSSSETVSFISGPTAAFTHSTSFLTVITTNNSTAGGGNNTYSWDFGDGNTSSQFSPAHVYTSGGAYVVTLTVTNECGSSTYTDTVNVTVVGLAEALLGNGTTIAPNPNNGSFDLGFNLENPMEIEVSIVNLQGMVVFEKAFGQLTGQSSHEINLGEVARGVYFAKIKGDGHQVVKKIVIE